MPYTQEFWCDWSAAKHVLPDTASLKNEWSQIVGDVIHEAQLHLPEASGYVTQGVHGIHSEHMSYLLADMQSLARQHPGAQW